ncbi:hypothetical protein ASZ78_012128, partial [Callipepla squamata]
VVLREGGATGYGGAAQGSPPRTVPLPGDTVLTLCPPAGTAGCKDKAVLVSTDLLLLLEDPLPLHWTAVVWKVAQGAEHWRRILTVWKERVHVTNSSLSERAVFQWDPLSLNISGVTQADSGNYSAEIESSDGSILKKCFHVSIWEPVGYPRVETHVLHQEQGRCRIQLSCTVPGATAVSYSWSRDGELLGNQSVLMDVQPGLYLCNVSNPANWKTTSINTDTACSQTGLFGAVPWWAVALLLVLIICSAGSITYWCWRRRKKDHPAGLTPTWNGNLAVQLLLTPLVPPDPSLVLPPAPVSALFALTPPAPPEHTESSSTIYEEVGRTPTGQEPNGNSVLHVVGNTVYATVHHKA